jgi:hypothetical protein
LTMYQVRNGPPGMIEIYLSEEMIKIFWTLSKEHETNQVCFILLPLEDIFSSLIL